jgi:hypothetical protein
MNIPTYVRRRVVDIDYRLTQRLTLYPQYLVAERKEYYLESISLRLSEWFILTYDCRYGMPDDYHKKVNEIIPVIKYLIRTKVIVHWEKMNGWG